MKASDIAARLIARGCSLNAGAACIDIAILANKTGYQIDKFVVDIFSEFNGIGAPDPKSMISLWSTEDILEFTPDYQMRDNYYAFSDQMFNAEIYEFCPNDKNMPIYIAGSKIVKATTLLEFWENMLSGEFDLR